MQPDDNHAKLGTFKAADQFNDNLKSIKHITDPELSVPLHFMLRKPPRSPNDIPDFKTLRGEKVASASLLY